MEYVVIALAALVVAALTFFSGFGLGIMLLLLALGLGSGII